MSDKTIVLIYPTPTQGYAKERRRDVHTVKRIYAPLTVMYLAAVLEEAGFKVLLLDQRLNSIEAISQKIEDVGDILFFGISTMTGTQIKNGLAIQRMLREHFDSKIPLVWGGVHPTLQPEETVIHPLVDIVCQGEGELIVVKLAQALMTERPLQTVPGIFFKENGEIRKTMPSPKIDPLDRLPFPAWHHLKDHLNPAQYPVLATITTSRGCPYNCTYCYKFGMDNAGRGAFWRPFSIDRIMDEVDYLHDSYGFDIFESVTENFIFQTSRAVEMIRRFKERKFKISAISSNFHTYKDDIIKELPGFCDYVAYSPETGSSRIQTMLRKKADFKKMKILNQKLVDINITTAHTFIFGFPFETDDDVRDTVKLCTDFKRINPHSRMAIYQYMPYPGAPLTDLMVSDYGLIMPEDLDGWTYSDMYGELDKRFRPWLSEKQLIFLNKFQLLFNMLFNTYAELDQKLYDIYDSDPKIRKIMGDISTIPRATNPPFRYTLNERLTPTMRERYSGRVMI